MFFSAKRAGVEGGGDKKRLTSIENSVHALHDSIFKTCKLQKTYNRYCIKKKHITAYNKPIQTYNKHLETYNTYKTHMKTYRTQMKAYKQHIKHM